MLTSLISSFSVARIYDASPVLISSFSVARIYDASPVIVNKALVTGVSIAEENSPQEANLLEAVSMGKASDDEIRDIKVNVAISD